MYVLGIAAGQARSGMHAAEEKQQQDPAETFGAFDAARVQARTAGNSRNHCRDSAAATSAAKAVLGGVYDCMLWLSWGCAGSTRSTPTQP